MKMKKKLSGHNFDSDDDLIAAMDHFLENQGTKSASAGLNVFM